MDIKEKEKTNGSTPPKESSGSEVPSREFLTAMVGKGRVLWGTMSPQEEDEYVKSFYPAQDEDGNFSKSNRLDYAKPVDIRVPLGYHAQVRKVWEMYASDPLFRYLIDRSVDFCVNGSEWEVPVDIDEGLFKRILNLLKNKDAQKAENEKAVWDQWSSRINETLPNVLPGIDEINRWIVKHLQLNAMAAMEWEWEKITINKVEYTLPIRLIVHNALSIALLRYQDRFVDEKAFLFIPVYKKIITEADVTNQFVGFGPSIGQVPGPLDKGSGWFPMNLMSQGTKQSQEAFVLKYNWTPGDNTTLFTSRSASVGQGLYPTPPYTCLFDILMLRRALVASDLAILDGIIHYIIDWSIGDATILKGPNGAESMPNQPRPEVRSPDGTVKEKSTIDKVKEALTSDTRGPVTQLFHPYYLKMEIKTPDVKSLISHEKYIQSIIEIFLAFGIFVAPTRLSGAASLDKLNIANFEQRLEGIRGYIRRFWENLCHQIVFRNQGKLTIVPNFLFHPLNTQDAAFKTALLNIAKIGKVSTQTLLQWYGLNDRTEILRIARELASGKKDLYDQNVPVGFVQSTKAGGKSSQGGAGMGGRPTGATGTSGSDHGSSEGGSHEPIQD